MDEMVDLRSDTVTRPTPRMRQAMFEAEVGDDVFGEDPTVCRLERRAAELLGKAAAVFVPSGTMGNQAAISAHTRPGEEIICDDNSHIVLYEMGMAAHFSGCIIRSVSTPNGLLSWSDIKPRLRPPSDHFRGAALIALENTHNMAGGTVYPLELLREIGDKAREAGVKVHVDGARIFNAAAALGVDVRELAAPADSITFCLSKGLGAPVGSVLVGEEAFIERARLARKALGGGMRQAGVIAAAGLVALEESPKGLAAAHADARFLAKSLAEMDEVSLDNPAVETNIVFFRLRSAKLSIADLRQRLRMQGILVSGNAERIRMLTHHDVNRAGCERAIEAIRQALSS